MANLFLLSRKAFVMCYCFRAPIKTFFFDACQMTVKSCVLHLFRSPEQEEASRLGHKSMEKNSVRNLLYGPKTRLIRGVYIKTWRVYKTRVHKTFIGNLARHSFSLFDRNKTQPQTSKTSEQRLAPH